MPYRSVKHYVWRHAVFMHLSALGEEIIIEKKNNWSALEMPQDFSMTNPSPFPTKSSGNWLLCLSGKNAGFSAGGDGWGKSMITPTPIQTDGEDRGAPLDVCQGTGRAPPPLFRTSQSKCLAEQTPYIPGSLPSSHAHLYLRFIV